MNTVASEPAAAFANRHVRFGWWSVLVFATFGLALETLHGFKIRAYLDVSNETRRLMWTLAHAHGTLLGVVNVLFALSLRGTPDQTTSGQRLASRLLVLATGLLPGGFFLGGVAFYSGDPGIGVLLLPMGAMRCKRSASASTTSIVPLRWMTA